MNNESNTPERILELNHEDRRTLLYRLKADDGTIMYYAESDLTDFDRSLGLENSMPLFYSLESAWRFILGFVDQRSLLSRSVWHQKTQDWLLLKPSFIHSTVRPLIMRALSKATRGSNMLNTHHLDGLRYWIGQASPSTPLRINYSQTSNTSNHAHAKRA